MDGHVDETSHVMFLREFENRKKYKEQILQEIIAAICAMLNSNGGKVVIHINSDSNIPIEGFPSSQMSLVIRILEQSMTSMIGLHQTISKINFKEDKESIVILVEKADSLITSNYNLYLPSETQVVQVSPLEPLGKVIDMIIRKVVQELVEHGSHCQIFLKGDDCGFHESNIVQLKNPKASSSKRTKLADRMTSKSIKFSCYVSAFANHCGGHIYYGIRDDGVVEGELISNEEDIIEITKKVEKTINKLIWPEQIDQPKRGVHWEIFFEPVLDQNSKPIPSTFVIVIYIAPCLGGVFTEEPECYEIVEGEVKKMSFATWKKRILIPGNSNDQSSPAELVPYPLSRIQWSSDEIKQKCTRASNLLMDLINNGKWKELKRKAKLIQQEYPGYEVKLMVLSKMVIAYSRQSLFSKARNTLSDFYEILRKVDDFPFFKALSSYLELVLKRNQKDFQGIEELLADALTNAESIEIGFLTAAINVLVATVSSFKGEESGLTQEKLCRTAIEHLRRVVELNSEQSVLRDLEQKAYITLVFSNLKCVLSKDMILAEKCTETDLKEAKSALTAFTQSTLENPLSRYREIQTKLAKSVLYYRQAQVKEDLTETERFLECALNSAVEAKQLAKKLAFDEMVWWSKTLISACTAALVRARSNFRNQHQTLVAYVNWQFVVQGVSKKTLRKFNRLSCIINVAKQFNFYIGRKNSYLAFQRYSF
jgi:hypothetical protein